MGGTIITLIICSPLILICSTFILIINLHVQISMWKFIFWFHGEEEISEEPQKGMKRPAAATKQKKFQDMSDSDDDEEEEAITSDKNVAAWLKAREPHLPPAPRLKKIDEPLFTSISYTDPERLRPKRLPLWVQTLELFLPPAPRLIKSR